MIEAEVALFLRGKAADGGTVEGEVLVRAEEEFLIVVEHVEAAFKIAEENGDGLDALVVGKKLQALFLNFVERNALPALIFGFEIEFFELLVRERQEIAIFSRHASPLKR